MPSRAPDASPASGALRRRLIRLFGRLHSAVYEASGGRIGARLGGHPMLLLHTVGRRTGRPRTTPLLTLADPPRYVVVASFYGSPGHPAWFRNLMAAGGCDVRVGRARFRARAHVAGPEERAALWPRLVAHYPQYADYQARTDREIPVVVLTPEG
jgi:deazaflavin-dependent oxidoreductase (nitroreductase family)